MRVLVFGMSSDKYGGINSFLLNMNKHMDENCIFDYVVDGQNCIHEENVKENRGIVFYVTPYKSNPFLYLKDIKKTVKKCRKDHKVAYFNLFSMVHMLPVVLCKLYGYKIVFHSHNSNIAQKNGPYRMIHYLFRYLFGGLKSVSRLTCAPIASEFMFGKGTKRSSIMIYNAIEGERFRYSEKRRLEVRSTLGLSDNYVVGFVGRLSAQKNPLFLIDIFHHVYMKNNNARLLIIGDGELKSDVLSKIDQYSLSKFVKLIPPNMQIQDYYQAMDVFLLPSLFEGLPVVLVETQTAGLPSVVSKEAVPIEACVKEGSLSFVSLNSSPDIWADRIVSLCNDNEDRNEWYEIVKDSKFNIDKEAKRLEDILLS